MIRGVFRSDLLRDRVALVCGGSGGIGAAIADALVECGAAVTVTGATGAEVEAVPGAAGGGDRRAIALDVRDAAAVATLLAAMARLDIVVNAAGVIRRDAEHDPAVFAEVVDINLTGAMRVCAAARPLLAKSRGCIVNVTSMLAYYGGGRVPGYSASKGGLTQLTKSLAIAYAQDRIRVNAVAPGWIATSLTQALQDDNERSAAILARTPLARWGKPADVAGTVVFLCSPAAEFVTGAIIPVDGGYLAA